MDLKIVFLGYAATGEQPLRQSHANRRTRLCLPKLISGELDVAALPEPTALAA
jgi:hypothetical protein